MSTPEFGFRLFAERLDGIAVGQVCRKQVDTLAQRIGELFQLFDTGAVQADNGALGVQDAGDLFADAAGCTGNEGLAARQIEHGWFPLLERIANGS